MLATAKEMELKSYSWKCSWIWNKRNSCNTNHEL